MPRIPTLICALLGASLRCLADDATTIPDPLDLGRVRFYFTSGVMLSNTGQFTHADLYLGLNVDRSWLVTNKPGWRRVGINTYFDTQLTSAATQTLDLASSFLQSEKAASLQAGVYIPLMANEWKQGDQWYSMFVAPLAKASVTTPTGTFFTSHAYGLRLGVARNFKKGDQFDTNAGPALVSYVDIATGRFGNFEAFRELYRVRPWRYSFEGILKIPESVFIVGFSANIGRGAQRPDMVDGVPRPFTSPRDDLRFLFGARFDFTKLLRAIPKL